MNDFGSPFDFSCEVIFLLVWLFAIFSGNPADLPNIFVLKIWWCQQTTIFLVLVFTVILNYSSYGEWCSLTASLNQFLQGPFIGLTGTFNNIGFIVISCLDNTFPLLLFIDSQWWEAQLMWSCGCVIDSCLLHLILFGFSIVRPFYCGVYPAFFKPLNSMRHCKTHSGEKPPTCGGHY